MKPETIRKTDIYMGRPICFLLTMLRRFRLWRKTEKPLPGKIRKILFIKFIEQGATVLAFNALCEAIETYGRENVYFAVFEENREILDILDLLPRENIFAIDGKKPLRFLTGCLKTFKMIRRAGIDASVDLEFFTRAPAIFAYMSGVPVRAGLHRFNSEIPYRGDLMTHRVQYNPYLHVSESYTLLVKALEEDPAELPLIKIPVNFNVKQVPVFLPPASERDEVKRKLSLAVGRETTGPFVLLNPNASDMLPLRKWPSDRFVALGKMILEKHPDVTLLITGAPSEQASAEEVARAIGEKRVFSMAGKTTLRELIVLYSLGEILVTNDSGPSHFSALTNIDTIVMFGPETPKLFGVNRANTHTLWAELACSPCVNVFNHRFSPCSDNRCMQAITADEVYGAVKKCLESRKTDSH